MSTFLVLLGALTAGNGLMVSLVSMRRRRIATGAVALLGTFSVGISMILIGLLKPDEGAWLWVPVSGALVTSWTALILGGFKRLQL